MNAKTVVQRRPRASLVAASLMIAGAAALAATGPLRAESHDIAIVDYEFQPDTLTVFVGEPITWTNNADRDHTVTSDEGVELDSGTIRPGEAYGHVFETPGTYAYHCELHPEPMTGTIVVQVAPATPTPSGSPDPTPPAGNLPSGFSPFPPVGPNLSPSPSVGPIETSPPPSPAPAEDGTTGGSPLGILLAVVAVGAVGAGAAFLLRRRGQP